jgi:tetratricopeptide (TPR) repeat protein
MVSTRMTNRPYSYHRILWGFVLLLTLTFLIYSNTFKASWHLDDYSSILYDARIRINDLQPTNLLRAVFIQDGHGKKLYRPLSRLTLAINWYFGKANVVGYHVVNVLIHFLTACFLFLTIQSILKLPSLRERHRSNDYSIALLSSTLWAINPIHTQAVTYIVQRMASLSAMFYVLSLFFYIKGRLAQPSPSKKALFFICCLLSYLLALASKENATILPLSLILVEICFFKDFGKPGARKVFGWALLAATLLSIGLAVMFMHGDPLLFLRDYEDRPFTLCQRLLTEPRVLVLYLTQIFYPVPNRLSIEHDISVSTSFLHPWTTLPSMLIILALIALGLSQMRKRPILAFGILFFFLNHLIESSVLGLELIFEHRNYLPSLFLFFPVATGVMWIIDNYSKTKRWMYYTLISFITLMLIGFGMGTYIRNMAWSTEKTLWEDAMAKAPNSARPPHNLAWGYYEVVGQYDKAMELYGKSTLLKWHSCSYKADALYGMAGIHFRKGENERAVRLYKKALMIAPKDEMTHQQLALSLIKLGRWDEALEEIEKLLLWRPDSVEYLERKAFVLLKQKKPEKAIFYLKKCLKVNPSYWKVFINMGAAFCLMSEYERAELYLRQANSLNPKGTLALLWLIEANLKTDDKEDVDRYMDELFALVRINGFALITKRLSDKTLMVPLSGEELVHRIIGRFEEKSKEIEGIKTLMKSQQR